ncbi:sugar phosphate isomerase/epimerase [Burkholderia pyrrocinia]|uniref:Sugar phosphate isomerase/epimerase n=1 Tax=Burkholderia pyrrocinia TaxID=60550 RepID=A0A2Z5MT52_BURPY|nr:sugar phosphate isomerase/epimerase [Burkholderia pyrrocinia]AXF20401.1 sugar phosphate isomerase/epimerase [Burkholderia pyrrocinia]
MSTQVNFVASYWTVSGTVYPLATTEVSPFTFEERVETAARAGFKGMGFVHQDLVAVRDRLGYASMKRILDANGIEDIEVEILTDWFADGDRKAQSDLERADLLEAGEALGARALKVSGDHQGKQWPHEVLVKTFSDLCADAGHAGMRVGIEIMPWSNFNSVNGTMEVVRDAGAKNGGLFVDIWHIERGPSTMADIARLTANDIVSVEINDAATEMVGDVWNDTLHHRLLPGEGSFAVREFIDAVRSTGYVGPWGVEILSTSWREKPLAEAAEAAIAAGRKFLA